MMPPQSGGPEGILPPEGHDAYIAPPYAPPPAPVYRWYHKLFAVMLATGCLVIGIFLIIFPWTEYWDVNYFIRLLPSLRQVWGNLYVKGAVSGIGIVNLYISLVEVFRLKRFSQHQ